MRVWGPGQEFTFVTIDLKDIEVKKGGFPCKV